MCVLYIGSAYFIFKEKELQYPHSAGCQSGNNNNNNTSGCWTNLNGCEPTANSSMFIGGHLMHYTSECVCMPRLMCVCECMPQYVVCVVALLHTVVLPVLQQTVCSCRCFNCCFGFYSPIASLCPSFSRFPPPSHSLRALCECILSYSERRLHAFNPKLNASTSQRKLLTGMHKGCSAITISYSLCKATTTTAAEGAEQQQHQGRGEQQCSPIVLQRGL